MFDRTSITESVPSPLQQRHQMSNLQTDHALQALSETYEVDTNCFLSSRNSKSEMYSQW